MRLAAEPRWDEDDPMPTTYRSPGRPPAGASPASSEDILLAALRAFAEHGYQGVSIRELNQALGVSHNLIFKRFGRKDQLWKAVVDRFFGAMNEELLAILTSAKRAQADPLAGFRSFVVTFVLANAERPEILRLMSVEAAAESDRLDYVFETYIRPMTYAVGELYESLVDQGLLVRLPPATIFFLLAHGATAPAAHVALATKLSGASPSDPYVIRRHAEAVADVLLNGIRAR